MRPVRLLLLAAIAPTIVLTIVAIDVLRLLPLKSAIYIALLATTAALAITHGSTPSPAINGGLKRNGSTRPLFQE